MTVKLTERYFSGSGKVFDAGPTGLSAVLREMAQWQAVRALSSVTDLTDNSGGAAANGTIEAIPAFTKAALGATDCAAKAELDAGLANVVDGLKEIVARLTTIRGKVPAFDTLTDSMVGTAADGTIGAIDVAYTGAAAALASSVRANAVVAALKNRISQATVFVNRVAVACGQAELVDLSGGTLSYSEVFAALPAVDTGTAVSGADTTDANAAVKIADAGAVMQKLADAVKELATKLNACTGTTVVPPVTVVAG